MIVDGSNSCVRVIPVGQRGAAGDRDSRWESRGSSANVGPALQDSSVTR
jgi:hypothetical protein